MAALLTEIKKAIDKILEPLENDDDPKTNAKFE